MKELIEQSKNIGIIINDKENLIPGLALFLYLKEKHKEVFIKINQALVFPNIKTDFSKIIFHTTKEVSEIYYEKKENEINLYITPKENLSKNDFSCDLIKEAGTFCCETIFSLGFKNFKELETLAEHSFKNIYSAKIINIDNSHLNKRFGTINLIENNASLAKIIFNELENELEETMSTFLLAGVKDGEIGTIEKILNKGGKIDSTYKVKSLEKTIVNLTKENNIYISELDNIENQDLPFIIQFLKICLQIPCFMLILNKETCIFYSKNEKILNKIKETFNAKQKNNGIIFHKENLDKQEVLNII